MPVINLEMDYNAAKEISDEQKIKLAPGPHKFVCKEVKPTESKKGNAQLEWTLSSIEESDPKMNEKTVKVWTSLSPKAVGFLVDITSAFGIPWEGTQLDTDQYVGQTCVANVEHDGDFTKIKSYV